MEDLKDNNDLFEKSIYQMESAAFNFAQRCINDSSIRPQYISQTRKLSAEYRAKVASGAISAEAAAKTINTIRNEILESSRLRSSDIGRSAAVDLKKTGLTFTDLVTKYAKQRYGKSFSNLTPPQKNIVYHDIIASAGRSRVSVNSAARGISNLGRGLLFITLSIAVYNVATAEEKGKALVREGAVISGGFAGGAAGGAVAGLACGPGAPVCVTLGVFIGGALGAYGANLSFGWFFK